MCQFAELDFSKKVLFMLALYILLHGISIYLNVAEEEVNKSHFIGLHQLSSLFLFIFHASMYYGFIMLNLVSLEFFLKIGEEILTMAHPRNLTLTINKTLTPVDQIADSIFTARVRPRAYFKETDQRK